MTEQSRGPDLVQALRRDYRQADLSARERALLDYAAKLTLTPAAMVESDLEPLRAAGLSDEAILDANVTVAYYAYVNRIADGLGVALEPHMLPGGGSEGSPAGSQD